MALPNFLGIGAARSGTTWLSDQLRNHPNIFLPDIKSVHYFDKYYSLGIDWYEEYFPTDNLSKTYKAIGEFTPYYLYDSDCPKRIHDSFPHCNLITILRNPIDRAYSDYGLAVRRGIRISFEDYIMTEEFVLGKGFYGEQIQRYLEYFSKSNILVLIYEKVFENPLIALNSIGKFLSVDPDLFSLNSMGKKVNQSFQPRYPVIVSLAWEFRTFLEKPGFEWLIAPIKKLHLSRFITNIGSKELIPSLSLNERKDLLSIYEPDIKYLERLMDIDLSIWRNITV
jgi:hypothetical protein